MNLPLKDTIESLLHGNQFASGGMLLMVLGAIGASLRAVPKKVYEQFLHLFSMTLTITDDTKAFLWFKWWFLDQERAKKIRHVDVFTPRINDETKALIFPAPGSHWFVYKNRPIRMTFERVESKKEDTSGDKKRSESITIRIAGRNQQFIRDLVVEMQKKYKTDAQPSKLYVWTRSYWRDFELNARPLESVILPKGLKERIVSDIQRFGEDKDWYLSTGVPYHRSYLLHGPPGTGKTSLLIGLAERFGSSIYLVKLASMSDDSLLEALRETSPNSMIVFEDVDCAVDKRSLKDTNKEPSAAHPEGDDEDEDSSDKKRIMGITLSGLLNALDGIETPAGSLFFLTTNAIEKLDPALLRPGRIDVKEFIGPANDDQKLEMYHRFFPKDTLVEALDFIRTNDRLTTMAEFQEELKLKRNEVPT